MANRNGSRGNRNRGTGHLFISTGLDQIGPRHSTGGGHRHKTDRRAAQKEKTLSARCSMSYGQRKVKPVVSLSPVTFRDHAFENNP